MGTLTGANILTRQRDLVQDVDAVRWADAEALRWLNDGIRDLCFKKPTAHTSHASMTLGFYAKQTVALTGAWMIVDVVYNLDGSGNPGRTIREAVVDNLDAIDPDWRTKEGDTVKHWLKDVEPHTFYVYPGKQKSVARTVEIVVATTPTDLTSLTQQIPVDDIYANALGYYLAFRLYSKDSDGQAAPAAATAYYQLFLNSLGA